MSIRNNYLQSVPYPKTHPYRRQYSTTNDGFGTRNRFVSTSTTSEIDEEDSADGEKGIGARTRNITESAKDHNIMSRIGFHINEQEIETDISSEDYKFVPSSSRAFSSQQLAYLSLPDLLNLSSSGMTSNDSAGENLNPRSLTASGATASPSYSIESVVMDLESEDIQVFDNISIDEVDDETEYTSGEGRREEDDDEFINMRVKVEKKPYPTKAMKVTVSVQPPSEVEEDLDELYEQYEDEDEVSASGVSVDVNSENASSNESRQDSSEESESVEDDEIEEESESSLSSEHQSNSSDSEDSGAGDVDSEDVDNDDEEEEEEEEVDDEISRDRDSGVKTETPKIIRHDDKEGEHKTESLVEEAPKDETEKMMELLSTAIDDSEKSKEKLILEKVLEAEAIAVAEGEKLAAQVGESKTSSPLVKVKGLGESVVSGVTRAVSSAVGSKENIIISTGEQGKILPDNVGDVLAGVPQGLDVLKVEKDQFGVVPIENTVKTQVKELDKRIHHEASAISGELKKSGEESIKALSSPSTATGSVLDVPTTALVVANVIVHGTPKSSLPNPVIATSKADVSNVPVETLNSAQPKLEKMSAPTMSTGESQQSSIQVNPVAPVLSQINVPENSPTSPNKKSPDKEEYLSVYAPDSMDSSEEEEDNIFRTHEKTSAETAEERKAVEQAKDKLIEDWKSTRRESIDEIDEKFQHILEDMVSELDMSPVVPVLSKKLKDAVHVSDEDESEKTPNKTLSARSSELVMFTDNDMFEDNMSQKQLSPISEHSSAQSNARYMAMLDAKMKSSAQEKVPLDKQNSQSSLKSLNSAGSNTSRKCSPSPKPISTPTVSNNGTPSRLNDKRVSNESPPVNSKSPNRTPSAKYLHSKSELTRPPSNRPSSKASLKSNNQLSQSPNRSSSNNASTLGAGNKSVGDTSSLSTSSANPVSLPIVARDTNSPNSSHRIQEAGERPSSKMLLPTSPKISKSNYDSLSLSSQGSKSPSMSRHSSLQTDQSMEEMGPIGEDENDLPNFNSIQPNSELGEEESESGRDDDSPSQRRKWKNSTEIASTLSHYLHVVKTETIENCVCEVIPLLTQLLVKSRKSKAEHALPTMIASLSAVRVLCERLLHVKLASGEKALRNMDLSWLLRILCKLSADPESKLKPEASFTLAKLVKAAGPELITRPIYFLLVMENDGVGHRRGSQGSKTKAAALDTLTYALLSFPKEEFDDLEEISRWVCLVVMHPARRVRQAALECIAVLGSLIGSPDAAASRFRGYLLHEAEQQYNKSDSDGSTAGQQSAIKTFDGKGIFDVSAITAISFRIRKRIMPLPSPQGLVEYGVKVPTGQELVLILTKMQEEEEDEFEGSTSDDSVHSSKSKDNNSDGNSESESIRMSDLEKSTNDKTFGKKQKLVKDVESDDDVDLITPDVAYILAGKGRVNKQELVNNNDESANNDGEATAQQNDKEKRKKALKRKRQKKRHVERTYSEYEDDSHGDE